MLSYGITSFLPGGEKEDNRLPFMVIPQAIIVTYITIKYKYKIH